MFIFRSIITIILMFPIPADLPLCLLLHLAQYMITIASVSLNFSGSLRKAIMILSGRPVLCCTRTHDISADPYTLEKIVQFNTTNNFYSRESYNYEDESYNVF